MTERMDTCASCRFCKTVALVGECRRRAPVLTDRSYSNTNQPEAGRIAIYTTEWPAVSGDDWCGDYENRRPA